MSPLTDIDTTPRNAPEVDGRLTCWRCRCDLDEELYCNACGATSVPPSRQPHTLQVTRYPAGTSALTAIADAARVEGVLTTETAPLVPIEFGTPRKAA